MKALLIALMVPHLIAAENPAPKSEEPPVQLPPFKVPTSRLERYTIVRAGHADGSFALRLYPGPASPDTLTVLVGGVQPGDEIVSIDGKAAASMGRHRLAQELSGDFTLVIRRPVGGRSFRLFEVTGQQVLASR